MSFVQNPINYAQQYAKELANAYPYLSYFSAIYAGKNSTRFRPAGGRGVWIPSMTASGARFVDRDKIDGSFKRNFNLDWQLNTMTMYREWDTVIDPMDVVETNDVATIGNVTRTFNELQKIPEMDAYAASKLAGFAAAFGGVDSTTLTSQNILSQWDSYLAYMTSQRVNRDRVVCYMTPDVYKLLKEAAGITRFVDTGAGIRSVDRNIGKLDGVLIVEVAPDLMKTSYDFTDGFEADANAAQINMLFCDPDAVSAPVVYEVSMITPPSAISKGKNVYYESYYYDVFALKQRQAGFFANMTAPALGNVTVTSEKGSDKGETVLTYTGDQLQSNGAPNYGLDAYVAAGDAAAPSVSYNAALPSGSTWAKVTGQNPLTLASQTDGKYATIALVNKQTNKAVAAGSVVEVVK